MISIGERMRTSVKQFELLVSYMEKIGGDLNKANTLGLSRSHMLQSWEELARALNTQCNDGYGQPKTIGKWRKVWSDLKNNTKRKAARIHKAAINDGPPATCKLSQMEIRVLKLMGAEVVISLDEESASNVENNSQSEIIMGNTDFDVGTELDEETADSDDHADVDDDNADVKSVTLTSMKVDEEHPEFEIVVVQQSPQITSEDSKDALETTFCNVSTASEKTPISDANVSTIRPSKLSTVSINKLCSKPANSNSAENSNNSTTKSAFSDSSGVQTPKIIKIKASSVNNNNGIRSPQHFSINALNDTNSVSTSRPSQINTISLDKLRVIPVNTLTSVDVSTTSVDSLNAGLNSINTLKSKPVDQLDECDLYCALLAKKLRSYHDIERQEIMYEIDGLMLKRKKYRPIPRLKKP